jgi:anti-sigma regulatory factor (Ser/Thr protein kinase)/ferredoxin
MTTCSYTIQGGDYAHAGAASRSLKEVLKKVGVQPQALRRVMIAALEAEMNVIIHAHRGLMRAAVHRGYVEIEVTDEGPGIADIELAMKVGYSTAPPEARALGWGAGLGLPNIKKNSDRFAIMSTVGQGTRLHFSVAFQSGELDHTVAHSLRVSASKCRECLRCLHACPTGAVRVRSSAPEILSHLCIDCASCIQACPFGALEVDNPDVLPEDFSAFTLVVPPSFLFEFGPQVSSSRVLAGLKKLGFDDIQVSGSWEDSLRRAVQEYSKLGTRALPTIEPTCPAVVNLIQMKFPSLLDSIAPYLSPLEAIVRDLGNKRLLIVALCPSQRSSIVGSDTSHPIEFISPKALRDALNPILASLPDLPSKDEWVASPSLSPLETLRVNGLRHVSNLLERFENGLFASVRVLQLFACDQGCFGSPLLEENPYVSEFRWHLERRERGSSGSAHARKLGFSIKQGMRLDENMSLAIVKLARIDELTRVLPGKDCGRCGAPSCASLAEDVVLGRAKLSDCLVRTSEDKGTS